MVLELVFGLTLGFVGSMPPAGPIAALVTNRSLDGSYRAALFIGAGAALAEQGYAFLAFLGFSTILAQYEWIVPVSRGLAAGLLVTLGLLFVLQRGLKASTAPSAKTGRSFALGFTISALNPTFLATWTAVVTMLFSAGLITASPGGAAPFAVGVGAGILAWWFVLVAVIRRVRGRFGPATLATARRATGVVLIGIGTWFAVAFLRSVAGMA